MINIKTSCSTIAFQSPAEYLTWLKLSGAVAPSSLHTCQTTCKYRFMPSRPPVACRARASPANWLAGYLSIFPDRSKLLSGGAPIIIPTFLVFQFYGDAER